MLSPDKKKRHLLASTSRPCNLPFIIIWGRSDGAAITYRLALDVILLAAREDSTVGYQQIFRNACIRNYNK
jgi:hypothetical protein